MVSSKSPRMRDARVLYSLHLDALGRSPATRKAYATALDLFEQYLVAIGVESPTLADLSRDNARGFMIWLAETPSVVKLTGLVRSRGAKTIREHIGVLKYFATFCVGEELLGSNPLASLKRPRATKRIIPVFRAEHVRALLTEIDKGTKEGKLRNLAMFLFLLATGARAEELCSLKIGDVNVSEGRARVLGKGRKERWLLFEDARTKRALAQYLVSRENVKLGDPLFANEDRRWEGVAHPMNRNSMGQLFKRWGKASGVEPEVRCSPHTCRHTFAIQFLRAHPGCIKQLQGRLGHESLEMVSHYARLTEADLVLPGPSGLELMLDEIGGLVNIPS
jgi:integrase/recombinase XerD